MSEDHQRGAKDGLFCGVPGTPCDCGNNYIEICKPWWHNYSFPRLVRQKNLPAFVFPKKYEAHHIVCVSPVANELLSKNFSVIRETQWCVNNKKNMIAMPLWGHTVKWYCSSLLGEEVNVSPPEFANIPQHDWDHNCKKGYTWEIEQELKDMAQVIKDSGHDVNKDDIKAALDNLSQHFERELMGRGLRRGGTHAAWLSGGKERKWYEPFSMASTGNLTEKEFPVRNMDEKIAKWIKRIAEAMKEGV